MHQYRKQWETRWNGHTIVAEQRNDSLLRTHEYAFVDGKLVCEQTSSWSEILTLLEAEIHDESGTHQLRIKFGRSDLTKICHVFVDGKLSGGDMKRQMLTLDETTLRAPIPIPLAEQKKTLKDKIIRQIIKTTIFFPLLYGLGKYFPEIPASKVLIFYLVIVLLPVVEDAYKLLKLSRQNPNDTPKNSTPV